MGRTTPPFHPRIRPCSTRETRACGGTAGWPREVTLPGLPQIRTCPIQASGSSVYGFAARRCRTVTHPVVAAIFPCFVEMVSRLDVRGICPSGRSIVRPPPSLHGVPWGGFPPFTGTMQRLRRLASPPHFVAFARRFHPDASLFAPCEHGRHAPKVRTISSAAPVDPGGPHDPGHGGPCDAAFRSENGVGSAIGSLSRLNHAACTRPVCASQPGSPPDHATLGSGWCLPFPGQDSPLQGSSRKFPSCRHSYMASPLSRLDLAQFPRERPTSVRADRASLGSGGEDVYGLTSTQHADLARLGDQRNEMGHQVTLKILPDAFADDPDRPPRFQREAQVLASLNHPNIAAIHGIEKGADTRALVRRAKSSTKQARPSAGASTSPASGLRADPWSPSESVRARWALPSNRRPR